MTKPTSLPTATLLPAAAVLGGGILMAAQSRANGTLASALGDPVSTGIWSIGSGWLLFAGIFLARRPRAVLRGLRGAHRDGILPWWMFLGGLIGGLLVTMQAMTVPVAGVALVLICVVAGQTLSALAVDHWGLGPGGAKPISRARAYAAAVTLVGVAVAVGPRMGSVGLQVAGPAAAALVVGGLLSVQAATNGRVNAIGGHPFVTTWINFTWGFTVVLGVQAIRFLAGAATLPTEVHAPWWAWTGGLLGLVYVSINAVAVRWVGVLMVTLLAVTGQLLGALVLDLADPVQRPHVGIATVAGLVITLIACLSAGVAATRTRQARDGAAPETQ